MSDEKFLYSGSSDGSLGIWDPVGLKHVGNFKAGHSKAVKSLVLHKGNLYSAGSDAVIKEWDIENQKVLNEAKDKGEINSICLQDNLIFSGSNDKTVKVYDQLIMFVLLSKISLRSGIIAHTNAQLPSRLILELLSVCMF